MCGGYRGIGLLGGACVCCLGTGMYKLLLAPASATLDTLGVNTIYVALQGEVSPASLTCFGSDETEHVPPLAQDISVK